MVNTLKKFKSVVGLERDVTKRIYPSLIFLNLLPLPKEVNKSIPKLIHNLTGNYVSGPNCWNATILYFDQEFPIRYVSALEMETWIEQNTYEDPFKLCSPGDIFEMRLSHNKELFHTAVWVGPGILFHKRGYTGLWEYCTEQYIRDVYSEAQHIRYLKKR